MSTQAWTWHPNEINLTFLPGKSEDCDLFSGDHHADRAIAEREADYASL